MCCRLLLSQSAFRWSAEQRGLAAQLGVKLERYTVAQLNRLTVDALTVCSLCAGAVLDICVVAAVVSPFSTHSSLLLTQVALQRRPQLDHRADLASTAFPALRSALPSSRAADRIENVTDFSLRPFNTTSIKALHCSCVLHHSSHCVTTRPTVIQPNVSASRATLHTHPHTPQLQAPAPTLSSTKAADTSQQTIVTASLQYNTYLSSPSA